MFHSPLMYLFIFLTFNLHAQFHFTFEEKKSFSDYGFVGDTTDFVIENNTLHLNAAEAGSSSVFCKTNIPDSIEFGLSFKLDFSPSSNNKLRFYLHIDTLDIGSANGYFLEIGENGATDKISFNRLINGESLTIGEGTEGAFSEDPVSAEVKIIRDQNGLWQVLVRKNGEDIFSPDLELFDSTIKRYFNQYFGLECIYTSTRVDKFHFDELYLKEIIPDTVPPVCSQIRVLDNHTLELSFDEIIQESDARNHLNFTVLESQIHPKSCNFNVFKPNRVILEFEEWFQSTRTYTLEVKNIRDLNGNLYPESQEIEFFHAIRPVKRNDIIINEILFDPIGSRCDFVELLNVSEYIMDLEGLIIRNNTKNNSSVILSGPPGLFPGEYLLLCTDTAYLDIYRLPDSLNYYPVNLPAFNNDEGNVTILSGLTVIDSFDYDDEMHFGLIQNTEGISLERISSNTDSNERTNWHSAAGTEGGATPGRSNSQMRQNNHLSNKYFEISNILFSPDNDGFEDQLLISYLFPREGFVGSVSIFDLAGNQIKRLVNNRILGTNGIIAWDGLNDQGQYCLTGPYIVFCKGFHASGEVFQQKLGTYLVEK